MPIVPKAPRILMPKSLRRVGEARRRRTTGYVPGQAWPNFCRFRRLASVEEGEFSSSSFSLLGPFSFPRGGPFSWGKIGKKWRMA